MHDSDQKWPKSFTLPSGVYLSLDFLGVKICSDIYVFSFISGKENLTTLFIFGLNDDNVSDLDHRILDAFTADHTVTQNFSIMGFILEGVS
jgi:hypothetical protein